MYSLQMPSRRAPLCAETLYNPADFHFPSPGGSWRSPPAFGLVRMRSPPRSAWAGWGEVYEARDTRLDRTVAIKVLPEHVASDPELKQRFEREAKTISSLSHPHSLLELSSALE